MSRNNIRIGLTRPERGWMTQPTVFYRTPEAIRNNIAAAEALFRALGKPAEIDMQRSYGEIRHTWNGCLWHGNLSEHVRHFLDAYCSPALRTSHHYTLKKYVEEMINKKFLTEWVVAVIGSREKSRLYEVRKHDIGMVVRRKTFGNNDTFSIKVTTSPRDEELLLESSLALEAAVEVTRVLEGKKDVRLPSGSAIRTVAGLGYENVVAHPNRALLLVYLVDPVEGEETKDIPIISYALSFPPHRVR